MEDPLWIVEILLCEGGDVEQWLEPQNMSLCLRLRLDSLSLNSLSCIVIIAHIHTCLILFARSHLFLTKKAIKAP